MSFDHSLSGNAVLRKEVNLDGAVEIMKPLFSYFGLKDESIHAILAGEIEGPRGIEAGFNEGTRNLYFYTSECVNDNFHDAIKETILRLNGAVEKAGYLTLQDYDTADLEDAVTDFWFGPSEQAIMDGMFESNLEKATSLLAEFLGDEEAHRIATEARSVYATQRAGQR